MTTAPQLSIPPGFEAVEQPDGSFVVRVSEAAKLSKAISFRMTTEEYNRLFPFVETFPNRSWALAMRWLLEQEAVRSAIADRVNGALVDAS